MTRINNWLTAAMLWPAAPSLEPVDERGGGRNTDEGFHIAAGAVIAGKEIDARINNWLTRMLWLLRRVERGRRTRRRSATPTRVLHIAAGAVIAGTIAAAVGAFIAKKLGALG